MGGENGVSQGTISYGACKDIILVHKVQLKSHFSGRMVCSGKSDDVIASVYSEKTHLKKLIMILKIIIIIIMNKSQKMTIFSGHQKLTSAMKLMPEK